MFVTNNNKHSTSIMNYSIKHQVSRVLVLKIKSQLRNFAMKKKNNKNEFVYFTNDYSHEDSSSIKNSNNLENENKPEIKLAKKSNKINVIGIIIAVIIFVFSIFTSAFNSEIHDSIVKIFKQAFSVEQNDEYLNKENSTVADNDIYEVVTEENDKTTSYFDNSEGHIIIGDEVGTITFLGIETLNVFCSENVYQSEVFYDKIKRSFRAFDNDENTVTLCELDGYGIYCEIENIASNNDGTFYAVLCDNNKKPISQEESREVFGLTAFSGLSYGSKEKILAFLQVFFILPFCNY